MPQDVTRVKAVLFRDIPSEALVVCWEFDLLGNCFEATATLLSGSQLGTWSYVIGPRCSLSLQKLRRDVTLRAMELGRLYSENQPLRMMLLGTSYVLPARGVFWTHRLSTSGPYRRATSKCHVGRVRLHRWLEALSRGDRAFVEDPADLA